MDHSLRTISYIADIGEILVIMARRRLIGSPGDTDSMRCRKQAKIICHVFESDEVIFLSQQWIYFSKELHVSLKIVLYFRSIMSI